MKNDKQKLARQAIERANGGLDFLEECLRNKHGGTDVAWSRSWYILLSFNFELILNSLLILESDKKKRSDIIKDIKSVKPSHDFEKLSQKISNERLSSSGIKSIKKTQSRGFTAYIVKAINKKQIIVQDLVDVRYDFKKDNLRQIDPNEKDRIKEEIKSLQEIVRRIQNNIQDKPDRDGSMEHARKLSISP